VQNWVHIVKQSCAAALACCAWYEHRLWFLWIEDQPILTEPRVNGSKAVLQLADSIDQHLFRQSDVRRTCVLCILNVHCAVHWINVQLCVVYIPMVQRTEILSDVKNWRNVRNKEQWSEPNSLLHATRTVSDCTRFEVNEVCSVSQSDRIKSNLWDYKLHQSWVGLKNVEPCWMRQTSLGQQDLWSDLSWCAHILFIRCGFGWVPLSVSGLPFIVIYWFGDLRPDSC